jgi:hypothetical protein
MRLANFFFNFGKKEVRKPTTKRFNNSSFFIFTGTVGKGKACEFFFPIKSNSTVSIKPILLNFGETKTVETD